MTNLCKTAIFKMKNHTTSFLRGPSLRITLFGPSHAMGILQTHLLITLKLPKLSFNVPTPKKKKEKKETYSFLEAKKIFRDEYVRGPWSSIHPHEHQSQSRYTFVCKCSSGFPFSLSVPWFLQHTLIPATANACHKRPATASGRSSFRGASSKAQEASGL